MGVPPCFLRRCRFREKCRRPCPDRRRASASIRGDRAGARLPVRLAAPTAGSDPAGRGLGQPVAGGRLAAFEAVHGRAALEFVHPLLEGEIFRTRGVSLAFDGCTQSGEEIFISGALGTLTMGDTYGALDWALQENGICVVR